MGTKKNPGRLCYLKADKLKRALHVLNLLPYISDSNDILLINLGALCPSPPPPPPFKPARSLTDHCLELPHPR